VKNTRYFGRSNAPTALDLADGEHRRQLLRVRGPRQKRHYLRPPRRLGVEELQPGHVLADSLRADAGVLGQMMHPGSDVIGAELRGRPPEVRGEIPDCVDVDEPRLRHVAREFEYRASSCHVVDPW
jgi:hypothetical protein